MSRAARTAPIRSSPTTPVAIGTARNVRARRPEAWLAERQAELLPVPYYHLVFTLPAAVADIAYQNKAAVYDLLFKASAEAMMTIAADPKHLGRPHRRHIRSPHLGLGADPSSACPHDRARRRPLAGRQRWISCRPGFFLPVRVLSRLFRRLFLERLVAAHDAGRCSSSAPTPISPRALPSRLSRAAAQSRMGRLRQASLRRTRGGAGLSRPATPIASPSPTAG